MATQIFNGFIDIPLRGELDGYTEIVVAGRTDEELRRRQIFFDLELPYKPFYGFIDIPIPQGEHNLVWPTGAQRFGNEF